MPHTPYDPLPPETAVDEEPFDDEELARYLAASVDDEMTAGETRAAGWSVTNDDLAEWALAKYTEAATVAADITDQAERHHARIEQWMVDATSPFHRRMDFFRTHLTDYALRLRKKGRKSLSLPSGKLVTRGPAPGKEYRVVVADPEAVIAWAHKELKGVDLEAVVRVKETVLIGGLRGFVAVKGDGLVMDIQTGQIVPGVAVEEIPVTADVQPGA